VTGTISRREFVVGVSAAGGVLAVLSSPAGMALPVAKPAELPVAEPAESQVLLYDPDHPGACRKVTEAAEGCAKLPIVGDRVRFSREFFAAADAPSRVEGLTSYSDYILLSGCAAEHGYRVVAETARGPLTQWEVERRAIS
jgi:hypothetical protein